MKKFVGMICVAFILGLSHPEVVFAGMQQDIQSRPLLGTVVTFKVCYEDNQEVHDAVNAVWERLNEINKHFHPFKKESDVFHLSHAVGNAVQIHPEVYELVKKAREYHQETQGAFDITIKPLSDFWKQMEREDRFPLKEELASVKKRMGVERLKILDNNQIQLPKGMAVDLSGLAQGYAADEVARVLREYGFNEFLIDTGGEIVASGLSCESRPWRVGVRNPYNRSKMLDVLELKDHAVSTSGGYEKFFEIQGESLSHIINPITCYPVRDVLSVSVISPRALEADVFSTALAVLGVQKGLALVESRLDLEALFFVVDGDGGMKRFSSSGFDKYLK